MRLVFHFSTRPLTTLSPYLKMKNVNDNKDDALIKGVLNEILKVEDHCAFDKQDLFDSPRTISKGIHCMGAAWGNRG
jgi:hypothetical protein